jgi:hypothetical protein
MYIFIQPSFGVHESSRILDIFKERKKKRKKQGKEGVKEPDNPKKRELSPVENCEEGGGKMGSNAKTTSNTGKENGQSSENLTVKERDGRSGKHPQLQAARMRLGGIGQRKNKKQLQSDISDGSPPLSPTPMQPETLCDSMARKSEATDTPDPSRLSLDDAATTTQQSSDETCQQAAIAFATSTPSPDALFIVVPRNELPDRLPGEAEPSIAVPAARNFVNIYYQYFSSGQINDLARYFTVKGQKSVSIGGAHSVVTGRNDIATQIRSLAGSAFVVRGVVAQDAFDGKGAHILVTGTAVTGSGGVTANFAHSVSLTQVQSEHQVESTFSALSPALEVGVPFQIHNDALALLSGESAPISQPQFTPPGQHPQPPPGQHPQPPPGLF